jgi:hypothetical protein
MERLTAAIQELQATEQTVLSCIKAIRACKGKVEANQEKMKAQIDVSHEKMEANQ